MVIGLLGLARREPWSKTIALGNVMATTQASQSWVTLHKGTSPNGWEPVALPVEELRDGHQNDTTCLLYSKPTALPMLCLMKPRAPCMCRQAMVDRDAWAECHQASAEVSAGSECLRDKRVMNESNSREYLDETCAIQNSSLYGLVLAHGLITSGRRVGSHGRAPTERLEDRAKPSIRHSAPTPRYEWCR